MNVIGLLVIYGIDTGWNALLTNQYSGLDPPLYKWDYKLVGSSLNADWLKAVVYQTVYHLYDKTFIFTALITLVTSF